MKKYIWFVVYDEDKTKKAILCNGLLDCVEENMKLKERGINGKLFKVIADDEDDFIEYLNEVKK